MTVDNATGTSVPSNLIVAICTRQRHDLLARLLKSIWAQPRPNHFEISVLVVDNNDSAAVKSTDFDLSDKFQLVIKHQPNIGLVHARNLALDTAEAMRASWILCVDDDEWVADDWLEKFINGTQILDGDMLVGRTNVIHDETQVFVPETTRQALVPGAPTKSFTSSNLAISKSVFDKNQGVGLRFDLAFNISGSEDTEFMFRAMRAYGLSVVNCPAAEVYEEWFGSRGTLWYRLKRRAKFQRNSFRIAALHRQAGYLKDKDALWVVILKHVNRSLVFGCGKILMGCLILIHNRHKGLNSIAYGLEDWAQITAIIPFLLGKNPASYGQGKHEKR